MKCRLFIAAVILAFLGVLVPATSVGSQEPEATVRIVAREIADGRIEFGLQQRQANRAWGDRQLPSRRFFPTTATVDRWLASSPLTVNSTQVRIVARRLADGRTEFGLQQRHDRTWAQRQLPTRRFFPATATVNRWLSSSPITLTGRSAASQPPTAQTGASEALSGIRVAAESCGGYDRDNFAGHGTSAAALGGVGYLTGRRVPNGDVDHVVALHEAWCSGERDPAFGRWATNLRASDASVNRGKGRHDPREWWNTDGTTSPRRVAYPGWCDYLTIHVNVKRARGMTMDRAEYDFVADQLRGCSGTTTAPPPPEPPPPEPPPPPPRPTGTCTHWHAGHPKHTHPGTNHDGTHTSGKCAGY